MAVESLGAKYASFLLCRNLPLKIFFVDLAQRDPLASLALVEPIHPQNGILASKKFFVNFFEFSWDE